LEEHVIFRVVVSVVRMQPGCTDKYKEGVHLDAQEGVRRYRHVRGNKNKEQ
jgi:hypothetical protein